MTYPKRGEMSEDGKFYTHTDGSVHTCDGTQTCLKKYCKSCVNMLRFCKHWSRIEGAYVQSAEEREACDMARSMIVECCTWMWGTVAANDCGPCAKFEDKSCPARAYLAAHGDANAWETNG